MKFSSHQSYTPDLLVMAVPCGKTISVELGKMSAN